MSKKLVVLLSGLLFFAASASATNYTSVASGAWTTTTNWSPNGTPGNGDVITINHAITRGATSFTWWTAGSVTIENGGSLSFSGNVDVTGSGVNIYVNTGGSISITGTLQVLNQAELAMQGGTLSVSGAFTVNGGTYSSTAGSSSTVASLTTSSSGSTSFTNSGTFITSGTGSVTANGAITNSGTMTIGGDLNGGTVSITNNGTMNISGSVDLPSSSKLYTNPGATTTVEQNVTTRANENLVVGTNAAPPPYAQVVIKGNLNSQGSGDVLVEQNGRLAVFGNFSSSGGGGSIFTVKDGGMVYVNSTITFNGGGDHLTNNNNGVPWGFYSNNQPVYNGGGSSSNGTAGSNSVQSTSVMQTDAPDFFAWVSGLSGSPLPVTLLFFIVEEITETHVALKWATGSELNFDYFLLERSTDGQMFETVGTIAGHGTTNQRHDYTFRDESPLKGKSYYRLTSIDFDGYREMFNLVSVNSPVSAQIRVYPNPVTDGTVHIDFNFDGPESSVAVMDLSGLVVSIRPLRNLRNELTLELESGTYLLKVTKGNETRIERLVVR